jgi:hypothetical protein
MSYKRMTYEDRQKGFARRGFTKKTANPVKGLAVSVDALPLATDGSLRHISQTNLFVPESIILTRPTQGSTRM